MWHICDDVTYVWWCDTGLSDIDDDELDDYITKGVKYDDDDAEEYHYDDEDAGDFIERNDHEETEVGSSALKMSATPNSSGAKSSPGIDTRIVDRIPLEGHYEVVSVEELMPIFDRGVDEVINLFDVDVDQAQVMLQKFKWHKEAL